MIKLLTSAALGLLLILGLAGGFLHPGDDWAIAGAASEKTITLAVKNMHCADCPFIVKKSLEAVPGVAKVSVSYKDKTAVVTYDEGRTAVPALIKATTDAGYPATQSN